MTRAGLPTDIFEFERDFAGCLGRLPMAVCFKLELLRALARFGPPAGDAAAAS